MHVRGRSRSDGKVAISAPDTLCTCGTDRPNPDSVCSAHQRCRWRVRGSCQILHIDDTVDEDIRSIDPDLIGRGTSDCSPRKRGSRIRRGTDGVVSDGTTTNIHIDRIGPHRPDVLSTHTLNPPPVEAVWQICRGRPVRHSEAGWRVDSDSGVEIAEHHVVLRCTGDCIP